MPDRVLDLSLGRPVQPAAGTLVLSASRVRDFLVCPRKFFLAHVLKVPAHDRDTDASAHGRAIHYELFLRHQTHELHDSPELVAHDIAPDPFVVSRVRAHQLLCPLTSPPTSGDAPRYLGGEVDLRWLIRSKNVLLTGRADALWLYPDGTLEVRDYKSGHCPDSLHSDLPASIYLLLAAAHSHRPDPQAGPATPIRPTRVRVAYERLGPTPAVIAVDGSEELVSQAVNNVRDFADRIRKEKHFVATASDQNCASCAYSDICPASVAKGT